MKNSGDRSAMKRQVAQALQHLEHEISGLSQQLHTHPELGYTEFFAARTAAHFLHSKGFDIELGIARMPTAFRASYRGTGGPTVALMAELDAIQLVDAKRPSLETIGHGCGHNIMTAAAVGAALGLSSLGAALPGRVVVLGSPAEETGLRSGGKELLCSHGYLNGVAAAMQIHPADRTYVRRPLWPAWSVVEFRFGYVAGRPLRWTIDEPHPFQVVMDELHKPIPNCTRLDAMAPPVGDEWTVGDPTHLVIALQLRGEDKRTLIRYEDEALQRARELAARLGLTVSAQLVRNRYDSMVDNLAMGSAFMANVQDLGEPIEETAHPEIPSLGDMGNVSHLVPSIHPFIGLGASAPGHSSAFAKLTGAEAGDKVMMLGAIAMAWTCIDVLFDESLRHRVWEEFLADPRVNA